VLSQDRSLLGAHPAFDPGAEDKHCAAAPSSPISSVYTVWLVGRIPRGGELSVPLKEATPERRKTLSLTNLSRIFGGFGYEKPALRPGAFLDKHWGSWFGELSPE
jgi:hypothetical protein